MAGAAEPAEPGPPQAAAPERPAFTEFVNYKEVEGSALCLGVMKPPGWQASDRRPAVVFFHGGGWRAGSLEQFAPQGRELARLGLVVFSAQYRFIENMASERPTVCVHDARSAVRWVRAHAGEYGVDPARIAAGGGSAGGHLAACTALGADLDDPAEAYPAVSPAPQALILFNPALKPSARWEMDAALLPEWERFSPLVRENEIRVPTLVMVGGLDTTTPPEFALELERALRADGRPARTVVYDGQTHGFFNSKPEGNPFYDQTLAEAVKFLRELGWVQ